MARPSKFFKWVVKLRMWWADVRGHHGKKWDYEPGDWYMGRKKQKKVSPEDLFNGALCLINHSIYLKRQLSKCL